MVRPSLRTGPAGPSARLAGGVLAAQARRRLSLLAAGALVVLAAAGTHVAHAAAATADDALYRDLGGSAGIQQIVDDFVPRLVADPRLHSFFAKANLDHLREGLVAQFCQVSGGPCTYQGPSMAVAHQDFDIRQADFNALVEDLQEALDAQGIRFAVQNRLLAKLAPMHRDIVNTP